jgi:hypothetical protein
MYIVFFMNEVKLISQYFYTETIQTDTFKMFVAVAKVIFFALSFAFTFTCKT